MVMSAGFCISKLMTHLNCVNGTEGHFTSSPALARMQFSRCLNGTWKITRPFCFKRRWNESGSMNANFNQLTGIALAAFANSCYDMLLSSFRAPGCPMDTWGHLFVASLATFITDDVTFRGRLQWPVMSAADVICYSTFWSLQMTFSFLVNMD